MRAHLRTALAIALLALVVMPCALANAEPARSEGRRASSEALPPIEIKEGCDFIAEPENHVCMLPFPDDYYTVADPSSATGRRVDFKTEAMPANGSGQHIEAAPYNASDGFSPGSTILLKVPGINNDGQVRAMKAAPINKIGEYALPDAPVVVIDAQTGARWPIWVEVDSHPPNRSEALLEIHPAVNFTAGQRYIVALRNLTKGGKHIEAPAAFRYYRDDVSSEQEAINARRPEYEEIFSTLETAGVARSSLYLAWDFTVASDANNTGRMLYMRNDAFAQLGDTDLANGKPEGVSPSFAVTSVQNEPYPGQIARQVKGTFEVPCFLFPNCGPGGTMQLDSEGAPIQNGTWTANFECIIPLSATTGPAEAARPALYGHGLLGSASEVDASPQRSLSQEYKIVQCATDEIGMAESDEPVVIEALENLSKFPAVPDRLQQGLLDELYLGRAMISPSGFTTNPAFHQDGTLSTGSVLNASHLFYNGNSQGGIMGGALTAVATDFTRASLGVGAMNYSVLIARSVDFAEFEDLLDFTYRPAALHPLLFDMMQMLWDRGEPDGYADRMTSDPLPDTPAHQVLMNQAFGDHQVTNYQSDVEARTIGASAHVPVLYKGRWPHTEVLWNVPAITNYPFTGSAIYYWDIGPIRETSPGSGKFVGVEPPPYENIPDTSGEDPHSAPRGAPKTEEKLVSDFYEGSITQSDDCEGRPCYAGGFTGPLKEQEKIEKKERREKEREEKKNK
jgi:hypothetical protein